MGKAETIVKDLGDNLTEAVGVRDGTPGAGGGPTPGPLDHLTRLRARVCYRSRIWCRIPTKLEPSLTPQSWTA